MTVRKILRASASATAAFQPVFIDIEIDGKKFQETHVDGGAIAQLFLNPDRSTSRPAACMF
jgi:predicted acylesterase/phospholipase RssA